MPKFCPNCKSIIFLKKDKNDNKRSFCNQCGFLDNIKIDSLDDTNLHQFHLDISNFLNQYRFLRILLMPSIEHQLFQNI